MSRCGEKKPTWNTFTILSNPRSKKGATRPDLLQLLTMCHFHESEYILYLAINKLERVGYDQVCKHSISNILWMLITTFHKWAYKLNRFKINNSKYKQHTFYINFLKRSYYRRHCANYSSEDVHASSSRLSCFKYRKRS